MGASKNVRGDCPYCGGPDLTDSQTQRDDRYTVQQCSGCGSHSARHAVNGAAYPLSDPSDPVSGWVVYNPTV